MPATPSLAALSERRAKLQRVAAVRVRNLARSRGIELVHITWDANLHGLTLSRLLGRYAIDTVLDVGAREGEFGTWLRAQGYRGRIVSFEPVSANLAVLRERAATDPGWEVRPYALGSENGSQSINVSVMTHFSSFLDARTDVISTGLDVRAVTGTEEVSVRRLEEVWDFDGAILLKCDTQGYDLHVLRGAGARLAEVSVLQTEVSNLPIYAGMPDMLESIAAVRDAGFTVSGLFPLNGGPDFTPIEFDLLAVRPGDATGPAR